MEQYLYGVIASEMLISSPPEALRAQAVVARTFAYTYMDKFTRDGFNLSADTSCQVYGGYDTEDPRAIEAVDSTRGQVLMYGGNTISAVYTSVCGGHTENNEDVWEGAPKSYLRGVKCGFCSDSVKYAWDLTIDVKDFVGRLSLKGVTLSSLSGLRPVSWSTNGRVKLVSISHDGSDILISANELRRIIGYGDIKSTWFDIRVDNLTDNRYVPLSGTQKINRIREIFRKRRSIKPLSTGSSLASIKDISSPSPEPRQNPENFIRNIIRTSMSKKGEVLSSGASIKINGRGHGHGVGMCQWGAANMARQGWDFKKILQHYYTGVDFRVLR
jgi:stage II sporulation protein D